MKKKYIQLPKNYISYSQVTLWESDPDRYVALYMDNRDELRTSNYGQVYGSIVAKAMEHQKETGDLVTDAAILLVPKYDVADQEIEVDMKTKDGWIKIVGRPDTLDSVTKAFREVKTGKAPWNQKRADDHLQLKFYAMIIYLKYGKLLSDCHLDWIATEQGPDGIRPTGRVESFRVNVTLKDILSTMALVTRVAREIEIKFASHVTNPKIATF